MSKIFFIAFFALFPSVVSAFDMPTENCPAPVTIFTFDDINAEIICGADWQLSNSGDTIISTTPYYWWQYFDNALVYDEQSPYPADDPQSENIDIGTTVIDNNFQPVSGFWELFSAEVFTLSASWFDAFLALVSSSGMILVWVVVALAGMIYVIKLLRRYVRS